MERQNRKYIERQIQQLFRHGKIDEKCQDALLSDLASLDAVLEQAEDSLGVHHGLEQLGFGVKFEKAKPYVLQVILPSCGQLPVNLSLPKPDGGPVKYANKQKILGIF